MPRGWGASWGSPFRRRPPAQLPEVWRLARAAQPEVGPHGAARTGRACLPRGSHSLRRALGGRLGGAAGPLRASFWRRLGVIDRSLGNAIRLSGSEGRAGGGRAEEARGFLEAAPRRLARCSRAGAWLAGAGPGRADPEAQSPGVGGRPGGTSRASARVL